jgi:hypothetical protein
MWANEWKDSKMGALRGISSSSCLRLQNNGIEIEKYASHTIPIHQGCAHGSSLVLNCLRWIVPFQCSAEEFRLLDLGITPLQPAVNMSALCRSSSQPRQISSS